MSVYFEAIQSGRLTAEDIRNAGGSPRRALRVVKRAEAEERNSRTPLKRTAHWRRDRAHRAARGREVESGD